MSWELRGWEECLGRLLSRALINTPLLTPSAHLTYEKLKFYSGMGRRGAELRLSGWSSFKQSYGSHRSAQFLKHEIALQGSSTKIAPCFNCHPCLGGSHYQSAISDAVYFPSIICHAYAASSWFFLLWLSYSRMWDSSFLITLPSSYVTIFIKSIVCVYVSKVIMWCLHWQCKHCSEKCPVAHVDYFFLSHITFCFSWN